MGLEDRLRCVRTRGDYGVGGLEAASEVLVTEGSEVVSPFDGLGLCMEMVNFTQHLHHHSSRSSWQYGGQHLEGMEHRENILCIERP